MLNPSHGEKDDFAKIKELIARGDLERFLIVCPGSLAEQWKDGCTVGSSFPSRS